MNDILEHAKHELSLINMLDSDVGRSIIKLIESSTELSKNMVIAKVLCSMPSKLLDKELLSPITEEDFCLSISVSGDKEISIVRCTRDDHIYKDPIDNEYYDDLAVCFINKDDPNQIKQYIYSGNLSSKKRIKLPYIRQNLIQYI
jgi:hypothetical protein